MKQQLGCSGDRPSAMALNHFLPLWDPPFLPCLLPLQETMKSVTKGRERQEDGQVTETETISLVLTHLGPPLAQFKGPPPMELYQPATHLLFAEFLQGPKSWAYQKKRGRGIAASEQNSRCLRQTHHVLNLGSLPVTQVRTGSDKVHPPTEADPFPFLD